ncbi:MAG: ABC transporter ATP-binding protein [Deltaproteobacteria bacterium]|nr:ABC transporter ATP-binding protein [Deltaproteobacteria bacterium]
MKPDSPAAEFDIELFRDRRADAPALRDIRLALPAGGVIGVIGHNGAGKSTLTQTLNRIVPTFRKGEWRGAVRLFGEDIADRTVAELSATVGIVFQDFETQLFSSSVLREAAFALESRGLDPAVIATRVREWLTRMDLWDLREREPASLSGGQKQRLALASVLAAETPILALDEPTTDLDPESAAAIVGIVRAFATELRTVLHVTHDLESLGHADLIVAMKDGRVHAVMTAEEMWTDPERVRACGASPPPLADLFARLGLAERPDSVESACDVLATSGFRATSTSVDRLPTTGDMMVRATGLTFGYRADQSAVRDVDLEIRAGELVALVGANGCGKTTLVKLLAGILRPRAGQVRVGGREVASLAAHERPGAVGLVFQNPDHQLFCATAAEEVAFGPRHQRLAPDEIARRVDEALAIAGLTDAGGRDPFAMTKGERKRLALASVLACRPRLLILDEPTTGLDAPEQERMMATLARLVDAGHAVLVITHALAHAAAFATRIIAMADGRIVADGDPFGVLTDDAACRASRLVAPSIVRLAHRMGTRALTVDSLAARLERA